MGLEVCAGKTSLEGGTARALAAHGVGTVLIARMGATTDLYEVW
jgi:hypothetical protein